MKLNVNEIEHLKVLLERVAAFDCNNFKYCHGCIFNYNYDACLSVIAGQLFDKIEEATNGKISNTP